MKRAADLGGRYEPVVPIVPNAASAAITADLGMFSEPVSGVSVAVAGNSTTTDANGNFVLTGLPLGNQTVVFSGSGIRATYALQGVEQDSVFDLWSVQVNGSNVTTEHTGTWVGTAGSDDPNSAGQIAFTLTIAANGNALSGTGTLAPPDASVWTMTGLENGPQRSVAEIGRRSH